MHKEALKCVKPVSVNPIQAFYTDRFQLFDVIEILLGQLNNDCDTLYMTSFSISEEFIRKIWRFRQSNRIGKVIILLDGKAAAKVTRLLCFAGNVFDEVYLTNNHGKVILFDGKMPVSICTSQNQTRGNRRESTVITTDKSCYLAFLSEIQSMIEVGVKL
jgi:hypothetical protein